MLYNPQLKGAPNFVPEVVALVLIDCLRDDDCNCHCKEKRNGNNGNSWLVSPMKPQFVIIAKAIPWTLF